MPDHDPIDVSIDHLVVGAASLEQGSEYLLEELGVAPEGGGKHETQGTHNRLLSLGPGRYLEMIAVDPGASSPVTARWFDLDTDWLRSALEERPRLLTWVARSAHTAELVGRCPVDLGPLRHMRRGAWNWLLTVPEDGHLPGDGLVPMLIEWQVDGHPSAMLEDQRCRLMALEATHRHPQRVRDALRAIGLEQAMQVYPQEDPADVLISAHVSGPRGLVRLDGLPVAGHRWRL